MQNTRDAFPGQHDDLLRARKARVGPARFEGKLEWRKPELRRATPEEIVLFARRGLD